MPVGEAHQAGVGFAIKSKIVQQLEFLPKGINSRLMSLRINLSHERFATLISAYAPTLTASDSCKDQFYEELSRVIDSVPRQDKLFLLGDFNARVGRDSTAWCKVIGHHGLGKENSNGTLLLTTCSKSNLVITNTIYQQSNKYKTTWMHPRSNHWHLLDYVIVRQRDLQDIRLTRVMRGCGSWSDHRLVRCTTSLTIRPKQRRQRSVAVKKLCVERLLVDQTRSQFYAKMEESLADTIATDDTESFWSDLKTKAYNCASEVLGHAKRKHQDWFDENDTTIQPLLDYMHKAHLDWINDKTSKFKKKSYVVLRQEVQTKLRSMKDNWWLQKAEDLQTAADKHDMKSFYCGLKSVFGPQAKSTTPILSEDGSSLLTKHEDILQRWADHFYLVLNRPSVVDITVLDEIPQLSEKSQLAPAPDIDEVTDAIQQISSGKASGSDGLPAEIFKCGGETMTERLTQLYSLIWQRQSVPQDFKDATIIHLYKRKGERSVCDNHRGISLLSIAGKILARVIFNRMTTHITSSILPESQCGFRSGRGTADMIFTARQLQEKCREQHKDLYMIFVDLTKAFDTVNRDLLWKLLLKIGCPRNLVNIIVSFHDGMSAQVIDSGDSSKPFEVKNGVKQGCVLAPLLFNVYFSMMLHVAFSNCDKGIYLQSRSDGSIFNLRRFNAKTKVKDILSRDLLFADDCALVAHNLEDIQSIMDCFAHAAQRFGLTVSLKKTEILFQPRPGTPYIPPVVRVYGTPLRSVDRFVYLGSTLSQTPVIDAEISLRLCKAGTAFGNLTRRLWNEHGVSIATKVKVYRAVVITTLLYGCETWTIYKRHLKRLDHFHMGCLRKIANVKWQDQLPNTEVLRKCNIPGLEALLVQSQLRWCGHLVRMDDNRLPKAVFYGQLKEGFRTAGGQKLRFKDTLKANLKSCGIDPSNWEKVAVDRSLWRSYCNQSVGHFEDNRVQVLQQKRLQRKTVVSSKSGNYTCDICGRLCTAKIGLWRHRQTHK